MYADEVGHENLHNNAMKEELREAFGNKIFNSEGEIIRSELAAWRFFQLAEYCFAGFDYPAAFI